STGSEYGRARQPRRLYMGSLHESALNVRHLARSVNGLRGGMSAAPLMTAARVAAGVTSRRAGVTSRRATKDIARWVARRATNRGWLSFDYSLNPISAFIFR